MRFRFSCTITRTICSRIIVFFLLFFFSYTGTIYAPTSRSPRCVGLQYYLYNIYIYNIYSCVIFVHLYSLCFTYVVGKTCMSALYACIMMLTMASATSLQDCEADMTGFELVTGYVFTAPDDLLDSIPGTLMLTDCLEACQSNDTCYSVNYETGLCVMFSSNADSYPGKNAAIYT